MVTIPPITHVKWPAYYRIIASRFPPIDLFERIAPPEDWEILAEIESLTNPRIRDSIGKISLVPPQERVSGLGAAYVMAPFVHVSPDRPSRFSDGTRFGVLYAARDFDTALREVVYHREVFHGNTRDSHLVTEERVLKGSLDATLHDIRNGWETCHHPTDYMASQQLAARLKDQGSNGILYKSVRHPSGENVAAFRPKVMGIPIQTKHISLHWNGQRIDKYFDYERELWLTL